MNTKSLSSSSEQSTLPNKRKQRNSWTSTSSPLVRALKERPMTNPPNWKRLSGLKKETRGTAKVPLVKTKTGRREVVVVLEPVLVTVASAVEVEFILTETEGVVELVVTVLAALVAPERVSPSSVPSTRNTGNSDKKIG